MPWLSKEGLLTYYFFLAFIAAETNKDGYIEAPLKVTPHGVV